MRKQFYLLLLLPLALGCNLAGLIKKKVDESQKPITLTSADSKTQLTIPGGWSAEKQLNEIAVLQAAHRFQEMYVIVIRESRQDFAEDTTLEDFAASSRTGMMSGLQQPLATDPVAATIGDYPAMEYQLEGTAEKLKVKYICTALETPNHYYQIITWTLPSRFERNQATLRQVAKSFRELKSD